MVDMGGYMYGGYGRLHVWWIWEVTCMVDMVGNMHGVPYPPRVKMMYWLG